MGIDRQKFLTRFAEEAHKHTSHLKDGVLALEKQPRDQETLNTLFRCAHTIKGSASMMNLPVISEFAHTVEHSLSSLREGSRNFTKELADLLLESSDLLDQMVTQAVAGGDITRPPEQLIQALRGKTDMHQDPPPAVPSTEEKTVVARQVYTVQGEKLEDLVNLVGELSVWGADTKMHSSELKRLTEGIFSFASELERRFLNIPADLTEQLHDLGSQGKELSQELSHHTYEMDRLTEALQSHLISLRMVPVSLITKQIPRLVRDTAARMNKQVTCTIRGVETELDKSIIDLVETALVHMVRNAVDHGIEPPEERAQAGKPEEGRIDIEAGYEGGMCRITITDDGRGIPVEKLIAGARAKHLITDADASSMGRNPSPAQLVRLVTLPGLSSSPLITDTSGRGVGMDVVWESIVRRLGGVLEIETNAGKGTRLIMKLPLNQAVMELLVVRLGSKQAALPVSAVTRVLRVLPNEFIRVAQRRAVRLDEQILPLVSLHSVFREQIDAQRDDQLLMVINGVSGQAALMVDEIITQGSYVIQTLPDYIQGNPWVSGCVITGSRRIMNVLNTQHIAEYTHQEETAGEQKGTAPEVEQQLSILVVDDSVSTRDIEKSILESHGYRVELASNGEEALETALEEQFDLIVSDIEMPRMDGMALTKRLRSEKAYRHTPIILVTSRDKEEDKIKGIEAGADAYIVKSAFDQDNLIKTIRTLTGT